MDQEMQRRLLIEDHRAYLSILDSRGVAYTPPVDDKAIESLPLTDLKRLVNTERDLARTPNGSR